MKLYPSSLLAKLDPPAGSLLGTPKQALPVDVALDYGLQLAKAVDQLHTVGIKIGDLKVFKMMNFGFKMTDSVS